MDSLPDKDFKPDEIDDVVRHYGKSIGAERKEALMVKLEKERDRFLKRQRGKDKFGDQQRDEGRGR